MIVAQTQGTQLIREVVDRLSVRKNTLLLDITLFSVMNYRVFFSHVCLLQLVSEVRKGGIKDKIIDLAINIRSMIVTDVERKVGNISLFYEVLQSTDRDVLLLINVHPHFSLLITLPPPPHTHTPPSQVILLQHPLHQISYSAEDRRFDNIFAYIVRGKKKDQPNICYVLESLDSEVRKFGFPQPLFSYSHDYSCGPTWQHVTTLSSTQASEIAATVGQAFQLAYERFQETKAAQAGFKDLKEKVCTG